MRELRRIIMDGLYICNLCSAVDYEYGRKQQVCAGRCAGGPNLSAGCEVEISEVFRLHLRGKFRSHAVHTASTTRSVGRVRAGLPRRLTNPKTISPPFCPVGLNNAYRFALLGTGGPTQEVFVSPFRSRIKYAATSSVRACK